MAPGNPHPVKRHRVGERTLLACNGCKQKKLKCDGQIPRCQNCSKNGRECLVEDPATGLLRPRDYMQSLEARVAYLEGLLQQVRPDVALDHLAGLEKNSSDFSPVAATSFAGPSDANAENDRQRDDDSLDVEDPADQLSTDVALLCLTTASKEPHYFGPSSAVSFSRVVSAAMNLPKKVGGSQASAVAFDHGGSGWNFARPFPIGFPAPPLGTTLSQAYFNNIHPQYPFLHRPTFQFWEELCFKAEASGNLSVAGDIAQFFVWMVYAIASLALGPTNYDTAESYYNMALAHQPSVLELDSIESIQSLLGCAVYSIRSPAGGSLWKLSGLAIRYCIELGYHRSASAYRKNSNPLIAEMSKRCFWVAYDIDRVASFVLGRPVGIPDDCIDAELPLDINDEHINALGLLQNPRTSPEEAPTSMTGAIHIIKLRRLWSKIGNNIYPTITKSSMSQEVAKKPLMDQLAEELEEWHANIPQPPDTGGLDPLSVFASREWFRLAYDQSVLLLYRYWITHKPPPGEEESVEQALASCAQKAKEICILYRRLFQYQSMQFTWGSLHILFLGGLTYLYCIWKSARVRQVAKKMDVINTCMACNTALVIIAERWNKATPYRDIFEVLSEKTIGLVCGDERNPQVDKSATTPAAGRGGADSQPLEDWIMELGASEMPTESEWFVQELLQGMRNSQSENTAEPPPSMNMA
ncbi:transcription activator acu-15 [Fusarium albosuccineum]|uniref:Transcription activator acu-15 n=1 Tax=Fusarium albosuccineum TaxID=1237068 RepID=A0A8H4P3S9_9HYPO|nr:transcription activator acu-15 [Fusarium albosuccineum]